MISSEQRWIESTRLFMADEANSIYLESDTLFSALDTKVRELGKAPANAERAAMWFLIEADRLVRQQFFQPGGVTVSTAQSTFGEGAVSVKPDPAWLLNAQAEMDRRISYQLHVADKILAANYYVDRDAYDKERIYLAWRMAQREMNNEILERHIPELRETVRKYNETLNNFFSERAFQHA